MKTHKVVSLFSGVGGFEFGLNNSLVKNSVVFSSELDVNAKKSYLSNFDIDRVHGDITQISSDDVPNHDILVGGFPCQSFSIAGDMKGFQDIRGTLFFDIVRILKSKKPNSFLLENVKNLVSHDGSKTIKTILKSLSDIGYSVDFTVLNSKNFGSPQNRERTYIIGFLNIENEKYESDNRNKKINEMKKHFNSIGFNSFNFFNNLDIKSGVMVIGDILECLVEEKYYLKRGGLEEFLIGSGYIDINETKNCNKILKVLDIPKYILKDNERQRRVYSVNGISPTVLARSDSTKILVNGNRIRKLTPRENFRVQGFDEKAINNIINTGLSDTQLYKQSGNAVTPNVITEIFNCAYKIGMLD